MSNGVVDSGGWTPPPKTGIEKVDQLLEQLVPSGDVPSLTFSSVRQHLGELATVLQLLPGGVIKVTQHGGAQFLVVRLPRVAELMNTDADAEPLHDKDS